MSAIAIGLLVSALWTAKAKRTFDRVGDAPLFNRSIPSDDPEGFLLLAIAGGALLLVRFRHILPTRVLDSLDSHRGLTRSAAAALTLAVGVTTATLSHLDPYHTWQLALAFTLIASIYGVQQAVTQGSPGYLWILPASALVCFTVLHTLDGRGNYLVPATILIICSGVGVRSAFHRITPLWGWALLGLGGCMVITGFAVDMNLRPGYLTVIVATPIAAMIAISVNSDHRTALISMALCGVALTCVLAGIGVNESSTTLMGAVRLGAKELVEAWVTLLPGTSEKRMGSLEVSDRILQALFILYLLLCYWVLMISADRKRDLIELHERGPDGSPIPAPTPTLQQILLNGSVAVGVPGTTPNSSTPRLLTALTNGTGPTGIVGRVVSVIVDRTPMRATVQYAQRPHIGPATVVIENAHAREARLVLQLDTNMPGGSLSPRTPADRAGYAILAHALSARGMPAWATWNPNGKGLAAWSDARRSRQARIRNGSLPSSVDVMSVQSALDQTEPRSLLLRLELASIYYEMGKFEQSCVILSEAVYRYPQFPEAWLRLSLSYFQLAEAVIQSTESDEGFPPTLDTKAIETLLDTPALAVVSRNRLFRRHGDRILSQCAGTSSEALRQLSRELGQTVTDLAAAPPPPEQDDQEQDDQAPLSPLQARSILASHFYVMSVATAQGCQGRLLRLRLVARQIFIQSERAFTWPLLSSRFAVRAMVSAARSIEVTARIAYELVNRDCCSRFSSGEATDRVPAGSRSSFTSTDRRSNRAIRVRLSRCYEVVDRQGTGWRAPLVLGRGLADLRRACPSCRISWSQLSDDDVEDRCRTMSTRGRRRALADTGNPGDWLGFNPPSRTPADH